MYKHVSFYWNLNILLVALNRTKGTVLARENHDLRDVCVCSSENITLHCLHLVQLSAFGLNCEVAHWKAATAEAWLCNAEFGIKKKNCMVADRVLGVFWHFIFKWYGLVSTISGWWHFDRYRGVERTIWPPALLKTLEKRRKEIKRQG